MQTVGICALLKEDLHTYALHEGGAAAALRNRHFWACASFRLAHWASSIRFAPLRRVTNLCCGAFWILTSALAGTDIRPGATIGRRFVIHTSPGLVIGSGAVIGDDCIANSGVCVVRRANNSGGVSAVIGNRVYLGVGSKILGVKVGDGAVIGANAVVTHDVPEEHIASGVPAAFRPKGRNLKGIECHELSNSVAAP